MLAGPYRVPIATKLRIPVVCMPAVSRRGISSVVEGETALTVSQEVGSEAAILERVRNSSLV